MEEDKDQKHICRFCSKSFPCGRSLGGHMRSHLITVPSTDHHQKPDENNLPKKKKTKKLPPLVKIPTSNNKPNKSPNSSEEDTLLQEKLCKECGKSFQSWKALFGHMKCHFVNEKVSTNTNTPMEEDYSSNSSNDHHRKPINDSQSDSEAATPLLLCKRKRSYRMKRYTKANTTTANSSSLTNTNLSSSVSEIDEREEQEEVALSLIILSRDKGNWSGNSNSDHSSEFLEPMTAAANSVDDSKCNDDECLKFKKLKNLPVSRNGLKVDEKFESEVNSLKNLVKGGGFFDQERSKKISKTRNNLNVPSDFSNKRKYFTCSICKKAFSSYQALGGHRASHKKFKGCCAPIIENSFEAENSHSRGGNNNTSTNKLLSSAKSKDHECPICFKVFSSGQALGGHKRSHGDQAKNESSIVNRKPIIEKTRNFLDLNLPAPDEEEYCNEFKPWWIETSHDQEPLLGLLSS